MRGWRHVEVTARRTAIDYARILRDLSDIHFARADKIQLVQDNLNTHCPASLYEAFEPAEARRLVERFEWHDTPPTRKRGTAAGSISPSQNLPSCPANASTGASRTPWL
jgi:hypothetical protein